MDKGPGALQVSGQQVSQGKIVGAKSLQWRGENGALVSGLQNLGKQQIGLESSAVQKRNQRLSVDVHQRRACG